MIRSGSGLSHLPYRERPFLFAGGLSQVISNMESKHHLECLVFPYLLHFTDGERILVGACNLPGAKVV